MQGSELCCQTQGVTGRCCGVCYNVGRLAVIRRTWDVYASYQACQNSGSAHLS
jgi:hypothetical protein